MSKDFVTHIKSVIDLPTQEEEKLRAKLQPLKIAKGEYYIKEGQVPVRFAFVNEGLFRYLYRDENGDEYTKNFLPEGNFISAYSAMILQSPSKMYVQALEDSHVTELRYADWLLLKQGHPCWNTFLVALLEKAFSIKEKRERDLLLLDASTRYQIFKEEFGDLEKKIKQHLVASYLGISPVSLSRIKNS